MVARYTKGFETYSAAYAKLNRNEVKSTVRWDE